MMVFHLDSNAAVEFWRRVKDSDAKTEQERTTILLSMSKEGLIDGIIKTNRSKDEYLKDLAKNFKVLVIGADKEEK